MRLILASASPRRRELLAGLGLPFELRPSAVEEPLPAGTPATGLARALALEKARDVAGRVAREPGDPAVVLGADTLVVLDGQPLGKPGSAAEARAMLAALAGRTHEVVTAVALVETRSGREVTETVVSRVEMRPYGVAEIEAYLATGEPYDKAGAYAVQGLASRFVEGIDGSYSNVVGLPISSVYNLLKQLGCDILTP